MWGNYLRLHKDSSGSIKGNNVYSNQPRHWGEYHEVLGRILRKVLPQEWSIISPRISTAYGIAFKKIL